LVAHDRVDLVSFTGGSATGRAIAAKAGLKPIHLELGGKSAAVVFADANLDQAAFQLTFGSYGLSGQACAASSRLLVEASAYDAFVDKLRTTASNMPMGDPLDGGTMFGPLIDEDAAARVEAMVTRAIEDGAEVVFGAERARDGIYQRGAFYRPTLLAGVDVGAAIAQEEVFGPVACAFTFSDAKEAVRMANATRYGLAASVWTAGLSRAHRTAAALRAGYVWINAHGSIPYTTPFGGVGESGHAREGGREAIMAVTRLKNVYLQL
jgi:acyl-CoA reductase-like NAD-dependent aldehyde dehydrogenase